MVTRERVPDTTMRGQSSDISRKWPSLALFSQELEGTDVTWPLQVTTEIRSGPTVK